MESLEVGSKFAGCRVESSRDTDHGHVWIFSRDNQAVVIGMPYTEYFTFIGYPHERERMLDEMAMEVHQTLRDRAKNPSTLDIRS